jgi:ribosomal-protein-alanine N-acetyltransferase
MLPSDREAVDAILKPSDLRVDIDAELERKLSLVWVLRLDPRQDPVGFLLAWHVVDELHLLEIATHPEMRRRGVARNLLLALLEQARSLHARLLLLEVRRSNEAAIRLYRSLGFRTTGVRRGYYADNSEDALEMRIVLNVETGEIVPFEEEDVS